MSTCLYMSFNGGNELNVESAHAQWTKRVAKIFISSVLMDVQTFIQALANTLVPTLREQAESFLEGVSFSSQKTALRYATVSHIGEPKCVTLNATNSADLPYVCGVTGAPVRVHLSSTLPYAGCICACC